MTVRDPVIRGLVADMRSRGGHEALLAAHFEREELAAQARERRDRVRRGLSGLAVATLAALPLAAPTHEPAPTPSPTTTAALTTYTPGHPGASSLLASAPAPFGDTLEARLYDGSWHVYPIRRRATGARDGVGMAEDPRETSAFGDRLRKYTPTGSLDHDGIDLAGSAREPVVALADGTVSAVAGAMVRVSTGEYDYIFKHVVPTRRVRVGQVVEAGQLLGVIQPRPNIGHGPHLHLMVEVAGAVVDPFCFFDNAIRYRIESYLAEHREPGLNYPSQLLRYQPAKVPQVLERRCTDQAQTLAMVYQGQKAATKILGD